MAAFSIVFIKTFSRVFYWDKWTCQFGSEEEILRWWPVSEPAHFLQGSKSVSKFFNTMKRQFTPQEWETINSSSQETEQLKTFYRLWCLKESYVKALGTGIGFEVERLDFKLFSSLHTDHVLMDTTVQVDGVPEVGWTFEESLLNNHCVAVAVMYDGKPVDHEENLSSTSNNSLNFVHLTIQELLHSAVPLSEVDPDYWECFIKKPEDSTQMKARASP